MNLLKRFSNQNKKMRNKKGLSVVVASVLMIVLVMSAVVIVWQVVKGIVNDNTNKAEDCFAVEFNEKVIINDDYTCYNATNGSVYISITLADEPIDSLIVAVESAGSSKSFELTNTVQNLAEVKNYPDYDGGVQLPSKNSGQTYYFSGFASDPDLIRISPKVGDNQCKITDEITQIESCAIMARLN